MTISHNYIKIIKKASLLIIREMGVDGKIHKLGIIKALKLDPFLNSFIPNHDKFWVTEFPPFPSVKTISFYFSNHSLY
ncbi:MAG: hypothetical protein Tsb005_14480 [Gammaproteobacteria bacterium]